MYQKIVVLRCLQSQLLLPLHLEQLLLPVLAFDVSLVSRFVLHHHTELCFGCFQQNHLSQSVAASFAEVVQHLLGCPQSLQDQQSYLLITGAHQCSFGQGFAHCA